MHAFAFFLYVIILLNVDNVGIKLYALLKFEFRSWISRLCLRDWFENWALKQMEDHFDLLEVKLGLIFIYFVILLIVYKQYFLGLIRVYALYLSVCQTMELFLSFPKLSIFIPGICDFLHIQDFMGVFISILFSIYSNIYFLLYFGNFYLYFQEISPPFLSTKLYICQGVS